QEEAPSLGKPVLVPRDATERPEVVELGAARLVGSDPRDVLAAATELLRDDAAYAAMTGLPNPYGDGHAADRVARALREYLRDGYAARPAHAPGSRVGGGRRLAGGLQQDAPVEP